ncbi:MAG: hypothetical protein AUG48_06130 [Actinobacteria bacterium 13_1_20CM_3_68_9]|nr:MAG: hypothetical protein AUG48_06130 [Actinobacteria bacterium 13_1_20CM_3_68_9]
MTAPHADQLIDGYLARLRVAAADLPPSVRDELIEDMRTHIAEARTREPDETDATVLNILDRLGEPDAVVAEGRPAFATSRVAARPGPYRPGFLEIVALILLPFLWPIGAILLWVSPAWSPRDKVIGSLLPPGGYLGIGMIGAVVGHHAIGLDGASSGSAPVEVVGAISSVLLRTVVLMLPLITVAYLAVRLRWGRSPQTSSD